MNKFGSTVLKSFPKGKCIRFWSAFHRRKKERKTFLYIFLHDQKNKSESECRRIKKKEKKNRNENEKKTFLIEIECSDANKRERDGRRSERDGARVQAKHLKMHHKTSQQHTTASSPLPLPPRAGKLKTQPCPFPTCQATLENCNPATPTAAAVAAAEALQRQQQRNCSERSEWTKRLHSGHCARNAENFTEIVDLYLIRC